MKNTTPHIFYIAIIVLLLFLWQSERSARWALQSGQGGVRPVDSNALGGGDKSAPNTTQNDIKSSFFTGFAEGRWPSRPAGDAPRRAKLPRAAEIPAAVVEYSNETAVKEFESYIALTPEQRDALKTRLSQRAATSREPPEEILKDIVGDSLFAQYQEKRAEAEQKQAEEELLDFKYSMARRLGLSAEQEIGLDGALKQAQQDLRAYQSAKYAEHPELYAGEDAMVVIQSAKDDNKKYEELVKEHIQAILNEDQLNEFLRLISEE